MRACVHRHSPRDWEEEGGNDATAPAPAPIASSHPPAAPHTPTSLPLGGPAKAPRGRLSPRMRQPGNLWQALWDGCAPSPACEQAPLQDATSAGEAALHFLELLPPPELFSQLLACAVASAGHILGAAVADIEAAATAAGAAGAAGGGAARVDAAAAAAGCCAVSAPARRALSAARAACAGLLSRHTASYIEEWGGAVACLRRAEGATVAALWLHTFVSSRATGLGLPQAAASVAAALEAAEAAAMSEERNDEPGGGADRWRVSTTRGAASRHFQVIEVPLCASEGAAAAAACVRGLPGAECTGCGGGGYGGGARADAAAVEEAWRVAACAREALVTEEEAPRAGERASLRPLRFRLHAATRVGVGGAVATVIEEEEE